MKKSNEALRKKAARTQQAGRLVAFTSASALVESLEVPRWMNQLWSRFRLPQRGWRRWWR